MGKAKRAHLTSWTPPEVIKKRSFKDMAENLAKIEQEQKEVKSALDRRVALAEKWLNLPEPERKEIREQYISGCNKFEAKKAIYLKDDRFAFFPGSQFFWKKRN